MAVLKATLKMVSDSQLAKSALNTQGPKFGMA